MNMNSNLRTGIVAISLFIILLTPILLINVPGVSAQYPDNASLSVGKATYSLGETVCITLTAAQEEIVFFNIISPEGIFYAALPSTDREYQFKPDIAGGYVINVLLRAGDDEKFLTTGFEVIDTDLEIVFGEPEQGAIELGEPVNWSQHISITNHERFSISNFPVSIPLPIGYSNLSSDAGFTIIDSSIPVDLAAGEDRSFNISYQTPPVRLAVIEESIGILDLIPPDAFDIEVYKEIGTEEEEPELTAEITVKQVKVWHNSSMHYHNISVAIDAEECEGIAELADGAGMVAEITVERNNKTVSWTIPQLSDRTYVVVEVTREQGDAEIDKPVEWQLNVSGTIVRYKTPAPFKRECKPVFANGKWKKEITIGSDVSVHYTNVTAFTSIDGTCGSDTKLFLIENGSRIDVTENPIYEVLFIDADEDGLTDKVQWNVPFLSDKLFEVEQSINVINVQSYPQVGGIWTVYFNTSGNGTLKIENMSPGEICFAGLYRDDVSDWAVVDAETQENITEAGWNHSGGKVEYRVLCGGKHTLKFTFGNVAYAYNQAGSPDLRVVNVTFDYWDTAENRSSVSETGAGYHVKEGKKITINATIANYGTGNITSNFNVSYFDSAGVYGNWNAWFGNYTYNVTVQGQLGNTTTGYPYNTTYAVGYWDPSLVGTHNISVWADPDNSTGAVTANLTNNNASAVINVSAWQKYYGNVSGSIALADGALNSLYDWTWSNETDVGYAYIVKDGASVNWSALHALGCDSDDTLNASGLDFLDADTNLAMVVGSSNATGFADNNITELWSGGDPSNATNTASFTVYGTGIPDVPIVNSTDMTNHTSVGSANFVTGILWDATLDTNGYYDTADDETLVFVTKIKVAAAGVGSAAHNYEFAAPCTLNPVVGGDLDIYMELK